MTLEIQPFSSAAEWTERVLGHPEYSKLADSQDSFFFYFIKVDPRKENFSLSATFTVMGASDADYQSGYGIMAVDTVNQRGTDSRHRNHVLLGRFRTPDGRNHALGLRVVGGYNDPMALRWKGRHLDPSRLFTDQPLQDEIRAGDRHRFCLEKTDDGFTASLATDAHTESISFPGCDCLLRQDRRFFYVGFAVAGNLSLKISQVSLVIKPGKLSHTPKGVIGHCFPDYPFNRSLLSAPEPSQNKENLCGKVVRVSPEGVAGLDLAAVLRQAAPGVEILLSDGIYTGGPYYIPGRNSGNFRHPIVLRAEHPGKAVIDGSAFRAKLPGMILRARRWIIDGLVFENAPSCGLFVCGSNNVIKNCEAARNGDTGFLICTYPGTRKREWPSGNRVEHCISHDNCDKPHRNADGFAAKLSVGRGNGFFSCKAFHNIDDGFDLYTKSTIGPIRPVVLRECEAAFNGWLSGEERPESPVRNGSGFKLGGERQQVLHRLKRCLAHDNAREGFLFNSNHCCILWSCREWNNACGSCIQRITDRHHRALF